MRLIKTIMVCLVVVLTGCASGIKYKDMASSIPPVRPDQGRIFFYRNATFFGAGVQPSIMLDGEKVGDSQPGGFFYVDRVPGNHEVTVTTEVQKKRSFELAAREIKYVKTSIDLGIIIARVTPDLMDPSSAKEDLVDLAYTGDKFHGKPGAQIEKTAIAQQPQDVVDHQAASQQAPDQKEEKISQMPANGAERWNGLMSCDARQDNNAYHAAYQAKFAMEISDNLVTVHRLTPVVAETLTGQITGGTLELRGEGYRLVSPDRRWQFKITGPLQLGAPIYSGSGNMLSNGKPIRACELTMTRVSKLG